MTRKTSSYRQSLLAALTDPVEAAEYLTAALEDSPESFLKALKNVAQARQISKVAKEAGIQRETLHRSFSEHGNPTWDTLYPVLNVLGMKINFTAASNQAETPRSVGSMALQTRTSMEPHTNKGGDADFIANKSSCGMIYIYVAKNSTGSIYNYLPKKQFVDSPINPTPAFIADIWEPAIWARTGTEKQYAQ